MTTEQQERYNRLPETIKVKIQQGKRLDKATIGCCFPGHSVENIYSDTMLRTDLIIRFNNRFGTCIK